jgi:hypothetical protein
LNSQRTPALKAAEQTLKEFPFSAERFEDYENVGEQRILETPFSLLYTTAQDIIRIIDLRDTRGMRSAEALSVFTRDLKTRYGIDPDRQ